jgi:hypothetical protein
MAIVLEEKAMAFDRNEHERLVAEYRAKALAAFPFELIETTGENALADWRMLKAAGRGSPIIIGGDENGFNNILMPFGPNGPRAPAPRSAETILAAAAKIRFPDDLIAARKAEDEAARASLEAMFEKNPNPPLPAVLAIDASGTKRTLSAEEARQSVLVEPREPKLGDWPTVPEASPGLTVVTDIRTGAFLPKARIALIPTADWTEIPAYLRWGAWNECQAPEQHVAAMRAWRDRYGAELVGLSFDTLNLTVRHPPPDRDHALALAREQYVYCGDIIDQGLETYSALAAALMANDWWYFWWD